MQIVKLVLALGMGFNLGNRFDNNEKPNDIVSIRNVIDTFVKKGFNSVRIPVTWYRSEGCMIDNADFMKKLNNAVDYSIHKGLKVIIDTHHENWLIHNTDGLTDSNIKKFSNLWTRIAQHYDYIPDNKIMYDILNEPHGIFDNDISKHNSQLYTNLTRTINEIGYKAVRSITKEKVILVEPNDSGGIYKMSHIYPTKEYLPGKGLDKKIAVSGHLYGPTEFTLPGGKNSYFKNEQDVYNYYVPIVNNLKEWHAKTDIQIVLGEFGIGDYPENQKRRDDNRVRAYYYYVTKLFLNEGWPIFVWCDSGYFKLYDDKGNWIYGLADKMIKAKNEEL